MLAITTILFLEVVRDWSAIANHKDDALRHMLRLAIATAVWAILPPIWFFVEFWFVFNKQEDLTPERRELFKIAQDQSKAIWASVVFTLGVLTTALAQAGVSSPPANSVSDEVCSVDRSRVHSSSALLFVINA